MDIHLYSRVLWRFRFLVAGGLLIAAALAFMSFYKVGLDGHSLSVTHRQHESWASSSMMLVTQGGFAEGRAIFPATVDEKGKRIPGAPEFASPERFESLAVFFSVIANSDAVHKLVRTKGPVEGEYTAKAVPDPSNRQRATLPFMTISGFATTPGAATRTAQRATLAFKQYLANEQARAKIPAKQQVRLQVLNAAVGAELVKGRRLTIPVVVFLTALIATLGLAFVLENLRPRVRPVPGQVEEPEALPTSVTERRSA